MKPENGATWKILRVYYIHRQVQSVSEVVRKYTLLDKATQTFKQPTLDDLNDARVVVTTLSTCYRLTVLDLPAGRLSIRVHSIDQGVRDDPCIDADDLSLHSWCFVKLECFQNYLLNEVE